MHRILVVDDELNMRLVLSAMLKKEGYDVVTASDGLAALRLLKEDDFVAVVTDLKMPNLDGMGLLERVAQDYPSTPVIIITAHGTIATAVDALKKGAFDFITKPFEQEELKSIIAKATSTKALSKNDILLGPEETDRDGIMGGSDRMLEIYGTINQVAPTTTTVLIMGETGTGKELIANAIHRNSPRGDAPFVKINCAAISENLMESELFGYERGAFTGAVVRKPGRFELAHKGTLFLDEVGELPKDMQVKLLRVIQEQEFERVGGLQTVKVDVRLITATNRNLLQDVKEGRFREDLFYRLNVFPIHLPPLRERKEDILPLTEYFLNKFNKKLGKNIREVDSRVKEVLLSYEWPGNIRELENLMERLVLVSKDEKIGIEGIPPEIKVPLETKTVHSQQEIQQTPLKDFMKSHMEELEKRMIMRTLEGCGGNVTKAAREIGISRKGLQLKMIKYNLRKQS